MKIALSYIIILLCAISSFAQGGVVDIDEMLQGDMPHFENVGDGMKEKSIQMMVEDSDGYLWIATYNGICRYDGLSYRHFFYIETHDKYVNKIRLICEDTIQNCMWALREGQNELLKIDKRDYKQSQMPIVLDGKEDYIFQVSMLFNYNDSLLLASDKLGSCLINKRTGHVTGPFVDSRVKKPISLFCPMISVNGECYAAIDGKLKRLVGRSVDEPKFDIIEVCLGDTMVRHISALGDTAIVIELLGPAQKGVSSSSKLISYNVLKKKTRELGRYRRQYKDIACCSDGVWLCLQYGILFFDFKTSTFREFDTSNSEVRDNNIQSLLKSKHQPIVWMGSSDGLLKTDYYYSKFSRSDMRRESESTNATIFSIYKDQYGNIWSGNVDGMYVKWSGNKRFERFKYISSFTPEERALAERRAVFGIQEDVKHGLLYLRTHSFIEVYDYKSRKLNLIKQQGVVDMALTKDNNLIMATKTKLYLYDSERKKSTDIGGDWSLKNISTIENEGDSVVWIGESEGGLYAYNIATKKLTKHALVGTEHAGLTSLKSAYRNGQRELWVLGSKCGLYYYLPNKRHLTKIDQGNMSHWVPKCIELDYKKNLWIGCDDGIVCINGSNGRHYEYDKRRYPLYTYLNSSASSVDVNGHILMAGRNYIIEFDSRNFAYNRYFPAPVISSYRFFNSVSYDNDSYVEEDYYGNRDTIEVPAGVRSLQVQMRVLNYSNPQSNKVQWRFQGVNDEWTMVNTLSPTVFSNLDRGVRVLEMRSCDEEGRPTSNIRRIYINKSVFFYEHPLFLVVVCVLCIGLIIFVIIFKASMDEKRRVLLQNEVERQAGELLRANEKLLENKAMIEKQNAELIEHRNNLEQQVIDRTRDIEEAKQKAEESSKLKSSFLANLSHEVRTPMNCIVGFAKLLADPACKPSDQKEFIHLIQESSQSLLVLIGDLLDVSRIESGQLRVNKHDFEVSREVYDVFRILSVERKNPNVAFELFADDNLRGRIIYSDKERFRQIIINICYNAFKFTDRGHVHLYADLILKEQLQAYGYPDSLPMPDTMLDLLLIKIEDTGIGIPQDKQTVIFEPFRKLNNNKTLYPGLGLGLNIVKNLVRILDGNIWLTSIEGQGTTFYFYLPF
ncbi:MAG: ATP-binding protein [Bacteroidales bacterium]|nr:ATP-binding protein [Bacteroidales bacterium]